MQEPTIKIIPARGGELDLMNQAKKQALSKFKT
jgi:hypothetical protein